MGVSAAERGSHRPRVWVVDDSATARAHLEQLLAERYTVTSFAEGPSMIEALQAAASPSLLVLDWEMPMMTGTEVCRFVRAQRDEIELPVLMVTGNTETSSVREALVAGANDIVRRPFDAVELLARIKNLLRLGTLADNRIDSLRALFGQVPAAVAHLRGSRHTYGMMNPAYGALVEHQYVIGRPFSEVTSALGPDPELAARLDRAYATGEAFLASGVKAMIADKATRARAEKYFDFTYQPTRDGHGGVDGIFVHAVDVTDSVHARQRAREQHEQLSSLFRQAPVAIAVLRGPSHVIELANPHVCALWARAEEAIIGRPLFDALPEIRGQGLEELLSGVLHTGVAHAGNELPVRVARGPGGALVEVYFNFVYQPMRAADGAVESVLVVASDVTDGVLARRETNRLADLLREREERLRLALAASEAGAWEVDLATRKVDGDQIVRALFEVGPGEHFSIASALALMHPEDAPRVHESIERALQGINGGAYHEQYRVLRKDGATTWIMARGQALFGPDGAAKRFLGTLLDVTARMQTEALREALLESERKAREVIEKQRDFEQYVIGIVSHDLRTPLQAIGMGTELLLSNEGIDDAARRVLVRVRNNADRATRMIRDVLDFTQVRLGGGFTLRPAPASLGEIATEMVGELRVTAPAREIEIAISGNTTGQWDADRLAQVVTNLVGNALKYSADNTRIHVSVLGTPDTVELAVHNFGPIIPGDRLAAIFQPMYRDASGHNVQRSVGLGLFIVEHIVTGHGGSIGVSSTADEGTTFRVRLPRTAALRS